MSLVYLNCTIKLFQISDCIYYTFIADCLYTANFFSTLAGNNNSGPFDAFKFLPTRHPTKTTRCLEKATNTMALGTTFANEDYINPN